MQCWLESEELDLLHKRYHIGLPKSLKCYWLRPAGQARRIHKTSRCVADIQSNVKLKNSTWSQEKQLRHVLPVGFVGLSGSKKPAEILNSHTSKLLLSLPNKEYRILDLHKIVAAGPATSDTIVIKLITAL